MNYQTQTKGNNMERFKQNFNNEVIGITEDGTIYTLNYVFKHDDGFQGAVGSCFVPVNAAYCKERNTLAAIKEYWESGTGEACSYKQAREFRQQELDYNAKDFCFQDDSYSNDYDKIKAQAKVKVKTLECVGGGRIFGRNVEWKTIVNKDLLSLIMTYEK